MSDQFATYLRNLRKQQNLTQTRLAAKAGISRRTLNYWESAQRQPRADELKSTLDALQTSQQQREQLLLLLTTPRGIQMARQQTTATAILSNLTTPMPDLGDLLTALRIRQGWSRARLAECVNSFETLFSRLEP